MNILRVANVATQGVPYFCLDFATRVFDVPNKYRSAWEAWGGTEFKHQASDALPDVPVPVWFSWWGTVDGEYGNWGHVVSWFPGRGLLSSPFNSSLKQQWFDSPQKVQAALGGAATYVGWSEDINGVRVADVTVKEEDMTVQEATAVLDSFFWNFVGRKIKDSECEEYVPYFVAGLPEKFFKKAKDFDEVKSKLNRDSVITYVQSNLK